MGQHIHYYIEQNLDGRWKKVVELQDKPVDAFTAAFQGKEFDFPFDRIIGTAGLPDQTTYEVYPDCDYGHCWFMLDDLLNFDFSKSMTLDGQPLESGRTWRDYLSDVLYCGCSDDNDVEDFLDNFVEMNIEPGLRVVVYFDH